MSSPSDQLRKAVIRLVLSVVLLDAGFITLWLAGGIALRPERQRWIFVGLWTAATLVVVLVGLTRVKKARAALRRGIPVR